MQKSSIFTIIFCVWVLLLKAQTTSQDLPYKIGYSIGFFLGISWPIIAILFIGFVVYRIVKRTRLSRS